MGTGSIGKYEMGSNAYKKRHKEQGLCVDCSRLATPGETRCPVHNYNNKMRGNRQYQKNREIYLKKDRIKKQNWRDTGRCPRCGAYLDAEIDEGCKYCLNCRIRVTFRRRLCNH